MNWILLILLLGLLAVNFYYTRNILSPSTLVCVVFIISTFVMAINVEWDYTIKFNTLCVIFASIFLFSLGANTKYRFGIRGFGTHNSYNLKEKPYFYIEDSAMAILSLLSLIIGVYYFISRYSTSVSFGNNGGVGGMLFALRNNRIELEEYYSVGIVANIGISFCRAIGYISLFMLIQSLVLHKTNWKKYIIPIVIVLSNSLLNERGALLTFVSAMIFDLYIILKINGIKMSNLNKRMIRYGILGGITFLTFFLFLGMLNGSLLIMDVKDTLSVYIGSPVLCFDSFLNSGNIDLTHGVYTFKGILGIISRLGINVPVISNHLDMVRWSGFASNIYTSLYTYLRDFGIVGLFIVEVVVGLIFGSAWNIYNSSRSKSVILFMYGRYYGYALLMYSIAERIVSRYVSLNVIVEILFSVFIVKRFVNECELEI